MKKLYSIFILTLWFSLFNNSYAIINTPATVSSVSVAKKQVNISLDLKKLSVSEMEAKLGHKLTWKQKLAMKLSKNDDGNSAIGFLLGFFLGLIGVLIAYLAFKDESKTIRGAWWGFGVAALLSIILIVVVLAASTV